MANRYSPEVRARAVRMVFEHQGSYETQAGAITAIPQTLREWVKQAEKESGMRDGLAPAEARRLTLARCTVARLMKQIGIGGVLYDRRPAQKGGLVHPSDRGGQYLSIRCNG